MNSEIFYLLKETKDLLGKMLFTVTHIYIYIEGNNYADFLVILGANSTALSYFHSFNLPQILRGLINLDRSGLPYIWFS